MEDKKVLMRKCLQLADRGRLYVSPNPMVGCVIVKEGKIIGEGYHQEFGGPHAEVNAIRSAISTVEGAEVYVNLEPCSYFGKTPPCVDLLIEKRVKKVYAAMLDPNPLVSGKGVQRLRDAGIEVDVGLLGNESMKLNEKFVKYISSRIPFVTLKIAQSLDGKIALENGKSKYITSGSSLNLVHSLRSEYDAVLVGAGTVRIDDPELTVRHVKGRSPVRIVLDGNLTGSINAKVFDTKSAKTVVIYKSGIERKNLAAKRKLSLLAKKGVQLVPVDARRKGRIAVVQILKVIGQLGFSSILVEGGGDVFSQFVESDAADKLQLFIAPRILGAGKTLADGVRIRSLSSAIKLENFEIEKLGEDLMVTGYFDAQKCRKDSPED